VNDAWDERHVLEGCRRGERAAQQELYVRTSERIYRILLRLARDPERAFDLAQETYLKAFSKITQFDGRSSLATWLYRIAVNEALYAARRATVADSAAQVLGSTEPTGSEDDSLTTRLDVTEALAQLPEADRAILALRYQEGLDYAAIAEITGLADGTIASRLNRARNRLREFLKSGYATAEGADAPAHQTVDGQNSMERDAQPSRRSHPAVRAVKP
jgi:RNA polymerase sigma-70 factor (ECF subfamily)